MYACMHVCMYAGMHVCMYVCMFIISPDHSRYIYIRNHEERWIVIHIVKSVKSINCNYWFVKLLNFILCIIFYILILLSRTLIANDEK